MCDLCDAGLSLAQSGPGARAGIFFLPCDDGSISDHYQAHGENQAMIYSPTTGSFSSDGKKKDEMGSSQPASPRKI
jgi:hypothetical protein